MKTVKTSKSLRNQRDAKSEFIQLIKNISTHPISCYSQKVKGGQEKQYFLGKDYIALLMKSIE